MFCIIIFSFAKFIANYPILPILFYANVPNSFPKKIITKRIFILTLNYFYKIIHSPFRFPFFLAIIPFSCISFILVLTVLNDLLIILAIASYLIIELLLIIFIIACSSKVQFLHFEITRLHFGNKLFKN